MPRSSRAVRRGLPAAAAAVACGLTLSSCASGGMADNTPLSNGKSFVTGNGATVYKPGRRPAAPAVSGTTLTGVKLSLASDRGKVVVLNFWGSWCTECRAEAPTLATLAAKYRDKGVQFVGVDVQDTPASAEAFDRDFGISYPSLNDPGGQVALDFRGTAPAAATPTTIVIGRNGHIWARILGQATYTGLGTILAKATATAT